MLSPITAAVKAKLGKTSKQATDIATLATKIRGEKKKKDDIPPTEETNCKKKDPVSQSERSFGSMTQNFSDIIDTVSALGTDYALANVSIKVAALTTKLGAIKIANKNVTNTFGSFKISIDNRQALYNDISTKIQRIKNSVKSQYGVSSSEYKLIKGLKV